MNTIKIGSQEWATEDLKVTKFRNGEDIPLVTDNEEWAKLHTAAYCVTSKGNYLYNWYAVNDPRGLAPDGFHVPTDDEWTELTESLGGEDIAGNELKTTDWNGTNSSGFSALPGGFRASDNGYFYSVGYSGYWWSSSANGIYSAWYRYLYSDNDSVNRSNYFYLRYGFSVRCLKNLEHQREMKDQFKPGQLVEVRDNPSQEWEIQTFVAKVDLPYPYLVHSKNNPWGITYAECRLPIQGIAELEEEISKLKNQ